MLPELKPDRILIAPDSALAEGAEFSLQYESGEFSGWLGYTHSRVLDRVDGEWLHRSWDQRDYASGGLSWRGDRWEASLAATWHRGLADDGGRAGDARAVPAGRRGQAQRVERLELRALRRARRPPLRPRARRAS